MAVVYVALVDEGTPVWRPVEARHIQGLVYELIGIVPDDETWEFKPGQFVECAARDFEGARQLVAVRQLPRP